MSLSRLIPLLIILILLAFFIAPLFAGICNLGNIAGIIMTSLISFMLIKPDIISKIPRPVLIISGIIAVIGFIILLIINVFMIKSVNDYPQNKNSTVIVLGCRVKEGRPSLMLKRRLDSAYEYLSENPDTFVIVSGGKGNDEIMSEAECMRDYLCEKGISSDRIIMEDKSSSTYENLEFSKSIIEENNLCSDIVIVTDGYHQLRAEMIAKSLDYENISNISAPTSPWLVPTYWVREWFGVAYQFLSDF